MPGPEAVLADQLLQEPVERVQLLAAGRHGAMLAVRVGAGAEVADQADAQLVVVPQRVAAGDFLRPSGLYGAVAQNEIVIADVVGPAAHRGAEAPTGVLAPDEVGVHAPTLHYVRGGRMV